MSSLQRIHFSFFISCSEVREPSVSGIFVKIPYIAVLLRLLLFIYLFLHFGGLIYPCTQMNWDCVNVHISYITDILTRTNSTSYLQDVIRICVHISDPDGNLEHHHSPKWNYLLLVLWSTFPDNYIKIHPWMDALKLWSTHNFLGWGNNTIFIYNNLNLMNTFFFPHITEI